MRPHLSKDSGKYQPVLVTLTGQYLPEQKDSRQITQQAIS
jgi:hypothetical protein